MVLIFQCYHAIRLFYDGYFMLLYFLLKVNYYQVLVKLSTGFLLPYYLY